MSEPEHRKNDQRLRQVDVRRIFDLVERHTAREITGGAGGGDFTNDIRRVRLFLSIAREYFPRLLFIFESLFSLLVSCVQQRVNGPQRSSTSSTELPSSNADHVPHLDRGHDVSEAAKAVQSTLDEIHIPESSDDPGDFYDLDSKQNRETRLKNRDILAKLEKSR
jgi:hypothetical protein